ncbi:MAG: hypothetical protein SF162_17130 [bacterium]|nr:hypothetical protein [bacterium]
MEPEHPIIDPATPETSAEPENSIPGHVRGLPEWAQTLIRDLRQESAARRAEIKRLKAAGDQAESERQAERGALDAALLERDSLKPRAERAETLDAYVRETVARQVAALPEAYRPLVPAYADPLDTLRWLEASTALLTPPKAPALDAGVRGDGSAARISAAERAMAAKLGISPEQYIKAKQ